MTRKSHANCWHEPTSSARRKCNNETTEKLFWFKIEHGRYHATTNQNYHLIIQLQGPEYHIEMYTNDEYENPKGFLSKPIAGGAVPKNLKAAEKYAADLLKKHG